MSKIESYDANTWPGVIVSETCGQYDSETVPDQTYSVQELLERHRQGILTDTEISRDSEYADQDAVDFDSPDFEKFRDSDLVDQNEHMGVVADVLEEAEKKRAADIAAAKAKEEAEYQEYLKQKASGVFSKGKKKPSPAREPATKAGDGSEPVEGE